MGDRRRSRILALQILYQMEMAGQAMEEAFHIFYKNFSPPAKIRPFSERLVKGVQENREKIDEMIISKSENWSIDRIAHVDKNILRIAIYELLFCHDIPCKVTMNEAIEIGKKFSTENTPSFINGILDSIAKELFPEGKKVCQSRS